MPHIFERKSSRRLRTVTLTRTNFKPKKFYYNKLVWSITVDRSVTTYSLKFTYLRWRCVSNTIILYNTGTINALVLSAFLFCQSKVRLSATPVISNWWSLEVHGCAVITRDHSYKRTCTSNERWSRYKIKNFLHPGKHLRALTSNITYIIYLV